MTTKYSLDFILNLKLLNTESPFDNPVEFVQKSRTSSCIPIREVLVSGENAWKSGKPCSGDEETLKKVKSILNKISSKNFESLSNDMYSLEFNSVCLLKNVIGVVFEKSVYEPSFGDIYASLCLKLSQKDYLIEETTFNFRHELVNQCQMEFEKSKKKCDNELSNNRSKIFGNITFIGELYIKELLPKHVIFGCINIFFKKIKNNENKDENIECLCKLLTTIGSKIDIHSNKEAVESCFSNITSISVDKTNSPRYRFMVKDILDLRKAKWMNKRDNKVLLKKANSSVSRGDLLPNTKSTSLKRVSFSSHR